jgi:hypothetical protein
MTVEWACACDDCTYWQARVEEKTDFFQYREDGELIGCGAAAWMNLIGWYDLNFNPTLLAGRRTGRDYEIKRIMGELADAIGTGEPGPWPLSSLLSWFGGATATDPQEMHHGKGYIGEFLYHRPVHELREAYCHSLDSGPGIGLCGSKEAEIRVVAEALKKGYPAIVGVNSPYPSDDPVGYHYAIVDRFSECVREPYDEDRNMIRVDLNLPRVPQDYWIPFEKVWGAWALNELKPTLQKTTISETSSFGPIVAAGGTDFYLLWTDENREVSFMRLNEPENYISGRFGRMRTSTKRVLGFDDSSDDDRTVSVFKPAAAHFKSKLYVAWAETPVFVRRATDQEEKPVLYYTTIDRRGRVGEKRWITVRWPLFNETSTAPTLAVFKERLYCAWVDKDRNIRILSTGDGERWVGGSELGQRSSKSPALAALESKLYVAWRGFDDRGSTKVATSSDGTRFSEPVTLSATTQSGPALHSHRDKMYIAWREQGSSRINFMHLDGTEWVGKIALWDTTISDPTLSSNGRSLIIGWTGTDRSNRLNVQLEEGS